MSPTIPLTKLVARAEDTDVSWFRYEVAPVEISGYSDDWVTSNPNLLVVLYGMNPHRVTWASDRSATVGRCKLSGMAGSYFLLSLNP